MHNNIWGVLSDILLILALSGLVIPLLQRMRISPVAGYLVCGLLIGPHGLGIFSSSIPWLASFAITDLNLIAVLAELGVVFLLFMIGMELTFSRLWGMRKLVLGLGTAQIILCGIVIYAVALQFGNVLATSVLIGAAFALSSTAVVMQLLTERHMLNQSVGRICFSVLLMQDLAVVPILVLVGTFSGHAEGSVFISLLKAVLTAVVVVAVIIAAGKLLLRPALRTLSPSNNVEWLLAVVLFLVIGSASMTHSFGLSAALGAFLAGLLIAETEYRHEIEVIIEPVKGILMGIFFLSVGMNTDIGAILQYPVWLAASVIGIFIIKALTFFPLAILFGVKKREASEASVLLAQCGEFAFIIIGLAHTGKLLPEQDAQFFMLVASLSLLTTPFMVRFAPLAARLVGGKEVEKPEYDAVPDSSIKNHVVIAGFGRVGMTLANILEEQNIRYIAIDTDGSHVHKLRSKGYSVLFGNARKVDLWTKLNLANASAAVITIDDFTVADTIVRFLRKKWPLIPIIVRVQNTLQLDEYYDAGATTVVPETLESTLQLVHTLMEQIGVDKQEAYEIINKHRQEVLAREL
ncbi:MAG: cation:proton antiporter [Methyloligellaceae bacterium]